MYKIFITTLLLGSLAITNLLFAQGNSGNNNGNGVQPSNCRPTIIIGEPNPIPGHEETYSHDYDIANGEQFVWEVEGAMVIDGQLSDGSKVSITKGGREIKVAWDDRTPIGKLKVRPQSVCSGLAQNNGGLGKIITLNKATGPQILYYVYSNPCFGGGDMYIASDFLLCGGTQSISIVGNSNATVLNGGNLLYNVNGGFPTSPTGVAYGINTNGEYVVTIAETEVCPVNGTSTTYYTYNVQYDPLVSTIHDIDISGNVCNGQNATFTALTAGGTQGDTYDWTINFGGTIINQTTNTNTVTVNVPNSATSGSVNVNAVGRCGSQSYNEAFTVSTVFPSTPVITMPTCYQGGTRNTFEVQNPQAGIEYCWRLTGITYRSGSGPTSLSWNCGLDNTTYEPDFGYFGNAYYQYGGRPGNIDDFTVELMARNCNTNTSIATPEIVNGVTYSACGGPAQISSGGGNPHVDGVFSIDLLPNPAQSHVTIKFPNGGGIKNIRIVDAYGMQRKNINTNSASKTINISDLPLGNYTVIAVDGNDMDTKHLQITQ